MPVQYSTVQYSPLDLTVHLFELPEVFPIQFRHPPPEVFVLRLEGDEQPIRHGTGDKSGVEKLDTLLLAMCCVQLQFS